MPITPEEFLGLGLFVGLGMLIFVIIGAFYIYFALAWQTIAKKLKYPNPWFAWIPFVNIAMILQLGGFHWAWVFLILLPILGWIPLVVLLIISQWKIYEKRKYPGWFVLAFLIPTIGGVLSMIILGFIAWGDRKAPMKF